MVQLRAFRRLLYVLALAFCSTAVVAISPASARSHHHGAGRHARAYHAGHYARRHYAHYRHRHMTRTARAERSLGDGDASAVSMPQQGAGFAFSSLVSEARRYLGGNPTSRSSLWCARFMNMVLQRAGFHGTGSDMAASFAHYGQRVSGPEVGAIAVMKRRGGGHVGIISGVDAKGNLLMISGNSHNRVREASVSRARIYAYVMPTS